MLGLPLVSWDAGEGVDNSILCLIYKSYAKTEFVFKKEALSRGKEKGLQAAEEGKAEGERRN